MNAQRLSAVIIARNEQETIRDCVRSVIEAAESAKKLSAVTSYEIVLVDSASSDNTVEIARRFPIRIFRLDEDVPLSAGAGSFVGMLRTTGDLVAIINGDMTIDRDWFVQSVPYLTPGVGAVLGVALERFRGTSVAERMLLAIQPEISPPFLETARGFRYPEGASAGTLLLRRESALAVGSYNPFLVAAEDFDLRLRLVAAGYRVLNIPVIQGHHFWARAGENLTLIDLLKTLHRNSIGLGQLLRLNKGTRGYARAVLRKCFNIGQAKAFLTACCLLAGLDSLIISATMGAAVPVAGSLFAAALLALAIKLSPRPLVGDRLVLSLYALVEGSARLAGLAEGLARRPLTGEAYPVRMSEIVGAYNEGWCES